MYHVHTLLQPCTIVPFLKDLVTDKLYIKILFTPNKIPHFGKKTVSFRSLHLIGEAVSLFILRLMVRFVREFQQEAPSFHLLLAWHSSFQESLYCV